MKFYITLCINILNRTCSIKIISSTVKTSLSSDSSKLHFFLFSLVFQYNFNYRNNLMQRKLYNLIAREILHLFICYGKTKRRTQVCSRGHSCYTRWQNHRKLIVTNCFYHYCWTWQQNKQCIRNQRKKLTHII